MRNKLNIKYLLFSILLFMSASSFAQIQHEITVKIESGETIKKYKGEKLESLLVQMYAVNYGNALTFSKENNQIVISNAQEPNAIIKIEIKNKLLVRKLFYDEKLISSIEVINFNFNNLPKNSQISSTMVDGKTSSYVGKSLSENTEGFRMDKTYKLFARLTIPADLNEIDSVFNSIADFFSQEDALLKIYSGSYAEQTQPLMKAYLKTNGAGKIENGIIWTSKERENGHYEIYSKGKMIKTEIQNLKDFQESIMDYFEKNIPD
ncbi:hypothetical protein GJU39_10570 [Pedobacter petrophilus]|uniref:Uncharacterized protein n=1 Tax=Pedobacter petrophilus TaxID=1908241 RepID=A0A7K0FYB8_9SPHI|nr:hypothetical protein [Pedobacter petrophilus]MRX76535.1 hypothetical protein [Pedobacter petrophilus]